DSYKIGYSKNRLIKPPYPILLAYTTPYGSRGAGRRAPGSRSGSCSMETASRASRGSGGAARGDGGGTAEDAGRPGRWTGGLVIGWAGESARATGGQRHSGPRPRRDLAADSRKRRRREGAAT